MAPLRIVELPEPEGAYVYLETLRPLLPGGPDLYAATCRIGAELAARVGGYAYAGVVRDEDGNPLTPPWLDARGYLQVDQGGALAVTGSVSHTVFGDPAALDLGARDGCNAVGWGIEDRSAQPSGLTFPPKQLLLGERHQRCLEPAEFGPSILSFDLSPDGETLALYEAWSSSEHSISLAELRTGRRRFLTSAATAGFGSVRFSPDGRWLLVASTLFEASTGRSIRLEPAFAVGGPADWSPAHGPSSLIVLDQNGLVIHGAGPSRILVFDLAHNRVEDLGPIELPDEPGLPHQRRWLSELAVAPDGRSALCGSKLGIGGSLPHVLGPQDRVSLLDLETRRVELLAEPLFEQCGVTVEREHSGFRWLGSPPASRVEVADELLASLEGPSDERSADGFERITRHARDLLVLGLNSMIDDSGAGARPQALVNEMLQALAALTRYAPRTHVRELQWVDQLAERIGPLTLQGAFAPATAEAWLHFAKGWERIKNRQSHPDALPTGVLTRAEAEAFAAEVPVDQQAAYAEALDLAEGHAFAAGVGRLTAWGSSPPLTEGFFLAGAHGLAYATSSGGGLFKRATLHAALLPADQLRVARITQFDDREAVLIFASGDAPDDARMSIVFDPPNATERAAAAASVLGARVLMEQSTYE